MFKPLGSTSPFSRACARPKRTHGQHQPSMPVHERSAGSITFENLPKLTSAEWCTTVPEAECPFLAQASSLLVSPRSILHLRLRLVGNAVWLDWLLRHGACWLDIGVGWVKMSIRGQEMRIWKKGKECRENALVKGEREAEERGVNRGNGVLL